VSAQRLDSTLAALADPYRRGVVDLLCERPRRAGELADAMKIAFPLMSRHLKVLRESGLVEEGRDEFDSRVRIYRLNAAPMADLKKWLDDIEAHWGKQLAAFKAHVQKSRK
jgi:DNA-binding transcriptional ArsR family regulator